MGLCAVFLPTQPRKTGTDFFGVGKRIGEGVVEWFKGVRILTGEELHKLEKEMKEKQEKKTHIINKKQDNTLI